MYILFCCAASFIYGQNYKSYLSGSKTDSATSPKGGVCLMGGSTENDAAMKWFLQRANGGDVLVLRASGSDGYNEYLLNELGIKINSVESIVWNDKSATNESYIYDRIKKAEAIWLAGGDQSLYVSYWRHTKIDSLINEAIEKRNIVIGGTSAGMAILGGFYYTGSNGSVTSDEALANPFDAKVTVDHEPFLKIPYLNKTITDTHYDARNRAGRHLVFMARARKDFGEENIIGIAAEEKTAICIDENGIAKVFGDKPSEDFAYFIFATPFKKKDKIGKIPFLWTNKLNAAKTYKLNGDNNGNNYISLKDVRKANGGKWFNWYVNGSGMLVQEPTSK